MQQLNYLGPDELAWREAKDPELDSDRAAIVRPLAVATCDLDALIVAGQSPFRAPFALGHECVAEVLDIGDGVRDIRPGQRVSVPFQISCGDCPACRRGRTGNCQTEGPFSTYGFGPAVERWGGFLADSVLVPFADHMLVAVPDALDPAAVASASDNISGRLAERRAPARERSRTHPCWWSAEAAPGRSGCTPSPSPWHWAPRR